MKKKDKKLAERIKKACIFAVPFERETVLQDETGSSLKEWNDVANDSKIFFEDASDKVGTD